MEERKTLALPGIKTHPSLYRLGYPSMDALGYLPGIEEVGT
jgi:hypothetical protein